MSCGRRWAVESSRRLAGDILGTSTLRPQDVVAVIMGGGAGTRLFPLTKDRAKPAVPLAGKYRLIDIPISNCINSDLRRIFVLTQFNSGSLHRHIQRATGSTTSRPASSRSSRPSRPTATDWYQGTADAVRQNLSTSTPTRTGWCSSSRATSSTGWTSATCSSSTSRAAPR